MESLGICLLGLGRAGNFHLQSLQQIDNARVVTVFDVDFAKSQQVAAKHHCDAASDLSSAILHPLVDAVIVATPTNAHFPCVQQALDAKKAVLTEKPLGCDVDEIDQSYAKADEMRRPLFVAFQRRFDPSFSALVASVKDGGVGVLQHVRSVSRDNPVPSLEYIRISGGIFHDCIVHDLDMVVHLVGEVPTHMSAFASSFIPGIGDLDDFDNVAATLRFANGVTATIDVNRRSVYGYDQRIEAFGDGGMVQADNQHTTSNSLATERGFMKSPVEFSFPTRYRQAYLEELKCFVRCAQGQEAVPITHADVRANHLLADGLELAARECRVVSWDELSHRDRS